MLKTLLTSFKRQLDIFYNKINNKNADNIFKTKKINYKIYI